MSHEHQKIDYWVLFICIVSQYLTWLFIYTSPFTIES